jgi:hypothetical protein
VAGLGGLDEMKLFGEGVGVDQLGEAAVPANPSFGNCHGPVLDQIADETGSRQCAKS